MKLDFTIAGREVFVNNNGPSRAMYYVCDHDLACGGVTLELDGTWHPRNCNWFSSDAPLFETEELAIRHAEEHMDSPRKRRKLIHYPLY